MANKVIPTSLGIDFLDQGAPRFGMRSEGSALYTIRPCQPEDAEAVCAVARRTWHATYDGLIPRAAQDQFLDRNYAPAAIAARAAAGRVTFLVATAPDQRVVGYAQSAHRKEPGDAELFAIYIAPEFQGLCLGQRLLTTSLDDLDRRGSVRRLFVQVERDNQLGHRFYARMGFRLLREYEDEIFGHSSKMVELWLDRKAKP